MNSTNGVYIKLGIGVMLFLTWVLLVVFKVDGSADIITAIKIALVGLGAYHLNNDQPTESSRLIQTTEASITPAEVTKEQS